MVFSVIPFTIMSFPVYVASINMSTGIFDMVGKLVGGAKFNKLNSKMYHFLATFSSIFLIYVLLLYKYGQETFNEGICYVLITVTGFSMFAVGNCVTHYMIESGIKGAIFELKEEIGLLMNYSLVAGIGISSVLSILIGWI